MVFDLHRQSSSGGVERGTFGYSPTQEHAVSFQPKVVVQAARAMSLYDEAVPGSWRCRCT